MANTESPARTVLRPCGKCAGNGVIRAYGHVAGGVCFSCAGHRTIEAPADWREREVKAAKRRKAREAKRVAAGDNETLWTEFTAAHPVEAARIWELRSDPVYGYAYSSVATYSRADSNPAQALHIIATATREAS